MKLYINLSIFAAFLLITACCKADIQNVIQFKTVNEKEKETILHLYPNTMKHPAVYTELFQILYSAKQDETIYIIFNGLGGDAQVALPFINAIMNSRAKINCAPNGRVQSFHAVIALACPRLHVGPATAFMFHKGGYLDENDKLIPENKLTENALKQLQAFEKIRRVFTDQVLTQEEQDVLDKDPEAQIWLTGTEVLERLRRNRDH